jgi:phage baseplate assembly protein V
MIAMFQRLGQRLQALVGVGKVSLVDDSGVVQLVQVKLGPLEIHDAAPNSQQYGFSSNPPVGTDVVMLFIGGDRSNGVVIATGNQSLRKTGLMPGDASLYDSRKQSITLTAQGIVIESAGLPITIKDAPTVTMSDTTLLNIPNGDVQVSGISLKNHVHGGVQSGGSETGAPQ